jgi:asparagine synthase (glutamine-hydrolysing)
MCGLTGIVDFSAPVDAEQAAAMADLVAHRGPDDSGAFSAQDVAFAHRRLAIIDLSRAGRQPMTDEAGRYTLVFNGEIYNYRELRSEIAATGYGFRTRTDTEVVLAAFARWGPDCVERFNGMWALAVWDADARTLFCSRDRFGEKPFYYRRDGSRLVFASELKAFRADPEPLVPNEPIVRDFLEQGYVDHTGETFFRGIVQLPAAHSLTFDANGLRVYRYWLLEARDPPAGDPAPRFRELFLDSVRLRLRSDVPIGTCLSGGLDSSAVAAGVGHLLRTEAEAAKGIGERQKTFTAYFEDRRIDERPYAREVVERTGAEPHWISFSEGELLNDLPAIVEAHDEPFRSTSIVAQWFVMRAARERGLKVMLDGQGGDESLAGYDGYFGFFFADLLLEGRLRSLAAEVSAYRRLHEATARGTAVALARPFVPPSLAWNARARMSGGAHLVGPALRFACRRPSGSDNGFSGRLRRQMAAVIATRLPELLHYEDRNSMAHSLEARVPFLDHRLVELLFSLGSEHLIRRGRTKMVLRRALADLLPPSVRDRVDKLGFETPESRWLRGALGDFAAEVFYSRAFTDRGLVHARAAQRRLELHRRGKAMAGSELWRALSLELWARAFLDGHRSRPHALRREVG